MLFYLFLEHDVMQIHGEMTEEEALEKALQASMAESSGPKVWQYPLWSFQGRDTKLERIFTKNQL